MAAAVQIARGTRDKYGRPIPLPLLEKFHRHRTADVLVPGTEDRVALWRDHAETLISEYRISVTYGVIAVVNGCANAVRRNIDVSPINNEANYTTFLHEIGHVATGCPPSHARASSDKKTVCVPCELEAWRFAIRRARPHWTRAMHDHMRSALTTYRPYGTPSEQREIDQMVSPMNYHKLRMERTQRG